MLVVSASISHLILKMTLAGQQKHRLHSASETRKVRRPTQDHQRATRMLPSDLQAGTLPTLCS